MFGSLAGLSEIKINTADIDKLVKSYKNLNIVASHGLYDGIIGYDDYVDEIFNCFAKYKLLFVPINVNRF